MAFIGTIYIEAHSVIVEGAISARGGLTAAAGSVSNNLTTTNFFAKKNKKIKYNFLALTDIHSG